MIVNQRNILDSGLIVMCVAGLIAWGSSQAQQSRLISDVAELQGIVVKQALNTRDIEFIKAQQEQQLSILRRLEKQKFGSNYAPRPVAPSVQLPRSVYKK